MACLWIDGLMGDSPGLEDMLERVGELAVVMASEEPPRK